MAALRAVAGFQHLRGGSLGVDSNPNTELLKVSQRPVIRPVIRGGRPPADFSAGPCNRSDVTTGTGSVRSADVCSAGIVGHAGAGDSTEQSTTWHGTPTSGPPLYPGTNYLYFPGAAGPARRAARDCWNVPRRMARVGQTPRAILRAGKGSAAA